MIEFSWEFGSSVETIFKSDLLSIGKIVVVSNNKSVVDGGGGKIVVVSTTGGGTVVGIMVVVSTIGGNKVVAVEGDGGGGGGGVIVVGAGGGTVAGGETVVNGRVKRDGPVAANGATGIGFCLKLKSKMFPFVESAGSGTPFVFNPNAFAKCWKNKLIVLFGRSSLGAAETLNTTKSNTINTLIFIFLYYFLNYVLIPGLFKSNWFRMVAV